MSKQPKVHVDINEDGADAIFLCGGGNPVIDSSLFMPKRMFSRFKPNSVNCPRCMELYYQELAQQHRRNGDV